MAKTITAMALIPARGGSKSVPRKNVRMLAGKPLLAHTIETARQARSVQRVVVSTDDQEIATISKQYSAEVIWRPPEYSSDISPSEDALLHALEYLRENEGYEPDLIIFLQCTSPLTLSEDIDATVQVLLNENADTALSVTPFHYFLWIRGTGDDAVGINHDKKVRKLRQQSEEQFLETGSVYVMRTAGFINARHRFFGKTALHVVPAERSLEIDEHLDFVVAEAMLMARRQQQNLEALPETVSALVLSFDGVFTDKKVIVNQDGREAVVCSLSDGWGVAGLRELDLPMMVLSSERNPWVLTRCKKLGIECRLGISDKVNELFKWARERQLDVRNIVYLGSDANDLDCMQAVGCAVAAADSHQQVVAAARLKLVAAGGQGAIRELAELIERRSGRQQYAQND